jgi:hypothetical protein
MYLASNPFFFCSGFLKKQGLRIRFSIEPFNILNIILECLHMSEVLEYSLGLKQGAII